jgi:hypothetical protein
LTLHVYAGGVSLLYAEDSSNWSTRITRFLFSGQDETASLVLGAGTAVWKLFEYSEHIDFLLSLRGEKFAVAYDFFTSVGWIVLIVIAVGWFVIAKTGQPSNTAAGTLRIILSCSVVAFLFGVVMSGRIWTPPDCKRVWQTLVQGSQLLTYIRLPYAA